MGSCPTLQLQGTAHCIHTSHSTAWQRGSMNLVTSIYPFSSPLIQLRVAGVAGQEARYTPDRLPDYHSSRSRQLRLIEKTIIALVAMFEWLSPATSATNSWTYVNDSCDALRRSVKSHISSDKYGNICWTLAELFKWKHGMDYKISITRYLYVFCYCQMFKESRCLN